MFKKNLIGMVGICLAIIGITLAIFQDDLQEPAPKPSEQLKENVIKKGMELVGMEVEETKPKHRPVAIAYIALGLLGLVSGVASYIKKENHRVSGLAAALGIMAMSYWGHSFLFDFY